MRNFLKTTHPYLIIRDYEVITLTPSSDQKKGCVIEGSKEFYLVP